MGIVNFIFYFHFLFRVRLSGGHAFEQMRISIRKATISDLPTLLQFEQEIIATERPFDECFPEKISYYDLKSMLSSDNALVLVAQCGAAKIVGSGFCRIKSDARHYLDHTPH